jgi:hypothetical protein
VDIAAVRGAYSTPWRNHWPGARLAPAVQANWFGAACRAAAATHLRGIYFWALDLSPKPVIGPTANG